MIENSDNLIPKSKYPALITLVFAVLVLIGFSFSFFNKKGTDDGLLVYSRFNHGTEVIEFIASNKKGSEKSTIFSSSDSSKLYDRYFLNPRYGKLVEMKINYDYEVFPLSLSSISVIDIYTSERTVVYDNSIAGVMSLYLYKPVISEDGDYIVMSTGPNYLHAKKVVVLDMSSEKFIIREVYESDKPIIASWDKEGNIELKDNFFGRCINLENVGFESSYDVISIDGERINTVTHILTESDILENHIISPDEENKIIFVKNKNDIPYTGFCMPRYPIKVVFKDIDNERETVVEDDPANIYHFVAWSSDSRYVKYLVYSFSEIVENITSEFLPKEKSVNVYDVKLKKKIEFNSLEDSNVVFNEIEESLLIEREGFFVVNAEDSGQKVYFDDSLIEEDSVGNIFYEYLGDFDGDMSYFRKDKSLHTEATTEKILYRNDEWGIVIEDDGTGWYLDDESAYKATFKSATYPDEIVYVTFDPSSPYILSDSDNKFGPIVYFYDFAGDFWTRVRSSEKDNSGPNMGLAVAEFYLNDNIPAFRGVSRWRTYLIPIFSRQGFLKVNIVGSGYTEPLQLFAENISISLQEDENNSDSGSTNSRLSSFVYDGVDEVLERRLAPGWTAEFFYYIGSRYPDRRDEDEKPSGVTILPPEGSDSGEIYVGLRVSMDDLSCDNYFRKESYKCVFIKGIGPVWTDSGEMGTLIEFNTVIETLEDIRGGLLDVDISYEDNLKKDKRYKNNDFSFEFVYPSSWDELLREAVYKIPYYTNNDLLENKDVDVLRVSFPDYYNMPSSIKRCESGCGIFVNVVNLDKAYPISLSCYEGDCESFDVFDDRRDFSSYPPSGSIVTDGVVGTIKSGYFNPSGSLTRSYIFFKDNQRVEVSTYYSYPRLEDGSSFEPADIGDAGYIKFIGMVESIVKSLKFNRNSF